MPPRTDSFDLSGLRLASGEGRRLDLEVGLGGFELGGEHYETATPTVPVRLDVSRTMGSGYALRLRFATRLVGPCVRCLEAAERDFEIDAREVSLPGEGAELESPYLAQRPGTTLDLHAWAHDALLLVLPTQILCRPGCAGLCPVCGIDLNQAGPDHQHDPEPDPRWAKLSELRFE
jgi:uncharacterized protein